MGGGAKKLADDHHFLGRIVAVGLEGAMIQVKLAADGFVGLRRANVQDFALAAHPRHRRVAHGRLPDFGVRLLVGPGGRAGAGYAVITPVMRDLILAPQTAHQRHSLGATGAPLRHPGAKGFAFLRPVAQPDAQDKPPLGDVIQRSRLLRHIHRIQQRQQQHGRRQLHIARLGRQPRQHRPGLKVLERVDQVVMRPAINVETGIARRPELRQVVPPLLLVPDGIPRHHLPHLIAYAHRGLP